jgi:hypothetical protein
VGDHLQAPLKPSLNDAVLSLPFDSGRLIDLGRAMPGLFIAGEALEAKEDYQSLLGLAEVEPDAPGYDSLFLLAMLFLYSLHWGPVQKAEVKADQVLSPL